MRSWVYLLISPYTFMQNVTFFCEVKMNTISISKLIKNILMSNFQTANDWSENILNLTLCTMAIICEGN